MNFLLVDHIDHLRLFPTRWRIISPTSNYITVLMVNVYDIEVIKSDAD